MIILCLAFSLLCGLCNAEIESDPPSELYANTFFVFYYKCNTNGTCNEKYALNELLAMTQHSEYKREDQVVLYIHGFHEDQTKDTVQMVVQSYTTRGECNLVLLDWSYTAADMYPMVVTNVKPIGEMIGKYLYEALEHKIFIISSLSVVGFSTGAQIGSTIGQTIFQMSGNSTKLPRITGLDPAGVLFSPNSTVFLTKEDAEFVDVIHTDAGVYGTSEALASVDFYPNGGDRVQSGCSAWTFAFSLTLSDLCSHKRSVAYWCESVRNKNKTLPFYAKKRSSNDDTRDSIVNQEADVVLMGIGCPPTATGKYFLITDSNPPYSLGMNGIDGVQ